MGYAQTIPPVTIEFGSGMEPPFTVGTVAADHDFTDATITLPAWMSVIEIRHAYVDMYVPYIQNTTAVDNYTDGTQYIQASVDLGAMHNCTKIFNNGFFIPNGFTYSGLYRVLGMYDIVSYLADNCTITFRWDNALAFGNSLIFNNVWFIMRVIA